MKNTMILPQPTHEELLNFALSQCMIDYDSVCYQLEMNKLEEIKSKHTIPITLIGGRMRTRLPWNNPKYSDGRENISVTIKYRKHPDTPEGRQSAEDEARVELLKKLKKKYDEHENAMNEKENNPTVDEVFQRWISSSSELKDSSLIKYTNEYHRFFDGKDIQNMKMGDITAEYLEDFIRDTIREKKLKPKSASFLHLIIRGIFVYGKRYTNFSIGALYIEMNTEGFRYSKRKERKKEVYTSEEARRIIDYCEANADPWNLGIALLFFTGIRIGELSGLYRFDFSNFNEDGCTLTVKRTEARIVNSDKSVLDNKTGKVAKTTKGMTSLKTYSAYRDIEVPSEGAKIVKKLLLRDTGAEYLFVGCKGERIGSNSFRKRLKSICEILDIEYAPTHKIRKTYASVKAVNGIGDAQNLLRLVLHLLRPLSQHHK